MLRTNAARAAFRALNTAPAATRSSFTTSQNVPRLASQLIKSRPTALAKPLSMALTRYQTTGGSLNNPDRIDSRHEQEVAKAKLKADPSIVSSTSSTHAVFSEVATPEEEKDVDMMAGVKGDLVSHNRRYTGARRKVD